MQFSFFHYPLIVSEQDPQDVSYPRFSPSKIIRKPFKLKTHEDNLFQITPKSASATLSSRLTKRSQQTTRKCQQAIQTEMDLELEQQRMQVRISQHLEPKKPQSTFKHYLNYKAKILPSRLFQNPKLQQSHLKLDHEFKLFNSRLVSLKRIQQLVSQERQEQLSQIKVSSSTPTYQKTSTCQFNQNSTSNRQIQSQKTHLRISSLSQSKPTSKKLKIVSYINQQRQQYMNNLNESSLHTDETFDQYVRLLKSDQA